MPRDSRHRLLVLGGLLAVVLLTAWPAAAQPDPSTPFREFAAARGVAPEALAERLGLPADTDLGQPIGPLLRRSQVTPQALQAALAGLPAADTHEKPKDWQRIRTKFALWLLFFVLAMVLLNRGQVPSWLRVTALLAAAATFGVWLGVEPNAPGTIKDALVRWGETHTVFRPRLVAFVAFLLLGIIGNKVFCGWLCQFGALQDLLFHLPVRKYKVPFAVSNAVRLTAFVTVAGAAVLGPLDLLEPVDPFRVFRPSAPLAVGVAFVVLAAGVFVYRPWCSFACPFGLLSWLGERLALARVRVNHRTCVGCRACERACPTHSMEHLRSRRTLPQDCFACGACLGVCPVGALRWGLKSPTTAADEAAGARPGVGSE